MSDECRTKRDPPRYQKLPPRAPLGLKLGQRPRCIARNARAKFRGQAFTDGDAAARRKKGPEADGPARRRRAPHSSFQVRGRAS